MKLKNQFVHSGQIYVSKPGEEINLSTVLGSCVSVCLYDEKKQISGMNHYLLPLWNDSELRTPKYGSVAIELLINKMLENGSIKKDLKAKVFGGGNVNTHLENLRILVGERNIIVAKDMLKEENIEILSSDLGGNKGRKLLMNSKTGKIMLKYV
jgi:chemotaxis protein CheD